MKLYNREDIMDFTSFNEITSLINSIYKESKVSLVTRGEVLFSEDLQKIEESIEELSEKYGVRFKKRTWYNMSTLTFEDINRWINVLNTILEIQKLTYPANDLYPADDLFPEDNLFDNVYCGQLYCGEVKRI